MTFPYRNILEVDAESTSIVSSLQEITWENVKQFNAKSDAAFAAADYRNHSIYASAAHKCAILFRDCGKTIL